MSDTETTTQIPDELPDYTDQDLDNDLARTFTPIRDGIQVEALVTKVERRVCKSGSFQIRAIASPVDESGNAVTKYKLDLDVFMPFANPAVDGHTAPDTLKSCYALACVVNPNFMRYPKKTDRKGVFIDQNTGKEIDGKQRDAISRELNMATREFCKKLWKNPEMLVGEYFHTFVKHETNVSKTNGKTYTNVRAAWPMTKPSDKAPVTRSDFAHTVTTEE